MSTDRVNFLQLRSKLNGEMTSSNGLRVMAGILVKIQYRGIQDVCIPAVKIGEPCKKKISYAAKFIDDLILVMNIQYGGVREMYNS